MAATWLYIGDREVFSKRFRSRIAQRKMREKKRKSAAKRTNATKNQGNTKTIKPIDIAMKRTF